MTGSVVRMYLYPFSIRGQRTIEVLLRGFQRANRLIDAVEPNQRMERDSLFERPYGFRVSTLALVHAAEHVSGTT